ncbi:hypothetical protein AAK938_09795 [Aerococcaceae bacterium 50-4]
MKLKLKHCILVSLSIICLEVLVPPTAAVMANEINNVRTEEVSEETPTVAVTEDELFINGESINEEQLDDLLATMEYVETQNDSKFRTPLAAGVYFIPGVGQVVLAATGAIILGGVTIYSGHWAYKKIKSWINNPQMSASRAYGIPQRLLDSKGNVKLGEFKNKVRGKTAWRDPKTGYTKEQDRSGHGGRKWKIKDKAGNRKASTDENGKILSK